MLDAPFRGIGAIASARTPIPGISLLAGQLFSNVIETGSFVHKVQTPTVIITRAKDTVIPEPVSMDQYEAIKATNRSLTKHIVLEDSGHNDFGGDDWTTYLKGTAMMLFQEK